MIPVSLAVITLNEEKHIKECLNSVPFVSEKIVVDSGSTDRTKTLSIECGAKFIHNDWKGYGNQKQFAIEQCTNDWVLLIDADEYLTPELIKEIPLVLEAASADAYELPIKQIFMGKVCHYGKSISSPVRLFNRKKGSYDLKHVHEAFVTTGIIKSLKGYAAHNSATTVLERLEKIVRDLRLELQTEKSTPSIMSLTVNPVRYFVSYFIRKKGYKDGVAGFILTALFTFQMFVQNAALFDKTMKEKISND